MLEERNSNIKAKQNPDKVQYLVMSLRSNHFVSPSLFSGGTRDQRSLSSWEKMELISRVQGDMETKPLMVVKGGKSFLM